MVTRSEAPDLAVDELKRRARRRLIGAIVLALGAAVLLPLLLENEPKPLGDEVSIQIPPIDNSKFVNPLSPGKSGPIKSGAGDSAKNAAPAADPAPLPGVPAIPPSEEKRNETQSVAPTSAPPYTPAPMPAVAPSAAAPPAPSATEAKKEPQAEPKGSTKQSDAPPTASGFVVQVAAFTDRYGAQAQARKLKHAGFPAYVESVPNGTSQLQRVRVGPYPSRDAADAARAKLKAAGYDAIVARAR